MSNFQLLVSFIVLSFIVACQNEDPPAPIPPNPPLTGCCDEAATNETFGNAKVYIPNIFTPNGDGLNDLFGVFGDSIEQVILFEVLNDSNELVVRIENIQAEDAYHLWDGQFEGEIRLGLYTYLVELEALDGTIESYLGKVCNYPCGYLGEEERISIQGCQFPSQSDQGEYNPYRPTNETMGDSTACFK